MECLKQCSLEGDIPTHLSDTKVPSCSLVALALEWRTHCCLAWSHCLLLSMRRKFVRLLPQPKTLRGHSPAHVIKQTKWEKITS